MPWKTFWMEHTGRERVGLRRYTRDRVTQHDLGFTCEEGFHQAMVWTGDEVATVWSEHGTSRTSMTLTVAADDPRWPAACDGCGRVFDDGDERQVWTEALFKRLDTGEYRVLHSKIVPPGMRTAEAGAMWDATWMPKHWRGADGISLMVRCPRNDRDDELTGSDWPVDMPSTNSGGRWTRVGDPRLARVTANPSISIGVEGRPGSYHGWLRDGVLTDPL